MDIRKPAWHAQLSVSGIGTPINHSGSVLSMFGEILKDLGALNPRKLSSGDQDIVIRIRSRPFSNQKESTEGLDRVIEVEARIDDSQVETGPQEGEDLDAYVDRLIRTGTPMQAALMIAADWYERTAPPELVRWLSDSQAQRFRQLNASSRDYESASPQEYATLKAYVLREFPDFCTKLTFRAA
jgi:hypothetical protein